ncbi:hypothetical protein M407DRAFT_92676 [Tulasnella calospora MUT 4182]|uniref:Uncharacterized protein n=1 Tax=Tulasnella calospora MUT 4182 TaxID=1051891 RepID=A0A0C3KV42_9AGAM|nr:hypothetical protein M407DRAFT_92676 [Tulasnella calospora MUT 4182]
MSYADIAKHNASGPQAHPDTGLLNLERDGDTSLPDVEKKVTVVPQSYKDHPETETSALNHSLPSEPASQPHQSSNHQSSNHQSSNHQPSNAHGHSPFSQSERDRRSKDIKKKLEETEEEGLELWAEVKERMLRPGTLGGLIGIVNVGLIGAFGYELYSKPHVRSDTRLLATAGVSGLVLLGAEGYLAEAYRKTAAGQEEERRAREEGAALYRRTKDIVLRPGVLGGIVGVVNVGILGGVGYISYVHWDTPNWDRRTVSAVTVGLITLFTGEGYLAEQYKEKEYPKRR